MWSKNRIGLDSHRTKTEEDRRGQSQNKTEEDRRGQEMTGEDK
jgi:hypothetical protein